MLTLIHNVLTVMANRIRKKRGGAPSYWHHFAAHLHELKAVEDGGGGGGGAIKVHISQAEGLLVVVLLLHTESKRFLFPHEATRSVLFCFISSSACGIMQRQNITCVRVLFSVSLHQMVFTQTMGIQRDYENAQWRTIPWH